MKDNITLPTTDVRCFKCPRCVACKECSKFKKISDLKEIGKTLYKHTVGDLRATESKLLSDPHDAIPDIVNDQTRSGRNEVLHNTTDAHITLGNLIPEPDRNKLCCPCPRCQYIMSRARHLVENIAGGVDKSSIKGVCDLCKLKQESHRTCDVCERVVRMFATSKARHHYKIEKVKMAVRDAELKKHFLTFLEKSQNLLKLSPVPKTEKKIMRSLSSINTESKHYPKICPLLSESYRLKTASDSISDLISQNQLAKLQKDLIPEPIADKALSAEDMHLKYKSKDFDSVSIAVTIHGQPSLPVSKSNVTNEYFEKTKHPQTTPRHHRGKDLHGEDQFSIRRSRSEASLITSFSGIKEKLLVKHFKYFFPRISKRQPKADKSSTGISKDTYDKIHKDKKIKQDIHEAKEQKEPKTHLAAKEEREWPDQVGKKSLTDDTEALLQGRGLSDADHEKFRSKAKKHYQMDEYDKDTNDPNGEKAKAWGQRKNVYGGEKVKEKLDKGNKKAEHAREKEEIKDNANQPISDQEYDQYTKLKRNKKEGDQHTLYNKTAIDREKEGGKSLDMKTKQDDIYLKTQAKSIINEKADDSFIKPNTKKGNQKVVSDKKTKINTETDDILIKSNMKEGEQKVISDKETIDGDKKRGDDLKTKKDHEDKFKKYSQSQETASHKTEIRPKEAFAKHRVEEIKVSKVIDKKKQTQEAGQKVEKTEEALAQGRPDKIEASKMVDKKKQTEKQDKTGQKPGEGRLEEIKVSKVVDKKKQTEKREQTGQKPGEGRSEEKEIFKVVDKKKETQAEHKGQKPGEAVAKGKPEEVEVSKVEDKKKQTRESEQRRQKPGKADEKGRLEEMEVSEVVDKKKPMREAEQREKMPRKADERRLEEMEVSKVVDKKKPTQVADQKGQKPESVNEKELLNKTLKKKGEENKAQANAIKGHEKTQDAVSTPQKKVSEAADSTKIHRETATAAKSTTQNSLAPPPPKASPKTPQEKNKVAPTTKDLDFEDETKKASEKAKKVKKLQSSASNKTQSSQPKKSVLDVTAKQKPPPTKEEPSNKYLVEARKSDKVDMKDINFVKTEDSLILKLVELKRTEERPRPLPPPPPQRLPEITKKPVVIKTEKKNISLDELRTPLSDLELDREMLFRNKNKKNEEKFVIYGESIINKKNVPKEKGTGIQPSQFQSSFAKGDFEDKGIEEVLLKPELSTTNQRGVISYALSDPKYIENGWTILPTEKILRKVNVYRMRPAQPKFDWFENNKNKGIMHYETGEKLAEILDTGRGRWFYRNGKLALDYYDTEERNAQQRIVIYSSGEPDDRGRTRPVTLLAMFDYLGNGVVFDHSGKIRLKYTQSEGVLLDPEKGPASHWKWHSLNDPPVLQEVLVDTALPRKDPIIAQFPDSRAERPPEDVAMVAIEARNFIKGKKIVSDGKFKPYQIRMKALKINDHFSLRVLDQSKIYLLYRDGSVTLKLNIGMLLDRNEILDMDVCEFNDVPSSVERIPAVTRSLEELQRNVDNVRQLERARQSRELRVRRNCVPRLSSADQRTAALSRSPHRPPLYINTCRCKNYNFYHPTDRLCNFYYDTRII